MVRITWLGGARKAKRRRSPFRRMVQLVNWFRDVAPFMKHTPFGVFAPVRPRREPYRHTIR
ncbi:MAG: hypothetical protein JWM74_3303 [Myxococcaceae bacterium]|jgi:hypothetical protein|nr:hypothetical protein [Myxococcaceae bacterium]